jgi:hypothetical protein
MEKDREASTAASTLLFPERRRSTRLEVLGSLHGQLVPLRIALKIREVGFGGFSIETVFPLPVGAIHDFRFTLRNGSVVALSARVAHCRTDPRSAPRIYVIGLEFADDLASRRKKANALVHEVELPPAS